MALRMAMLKSAACDTGHMAGLRRLLHVAALTPPLDGVIERPATSPPSVLPEFDQNHPSHINYKNMGFGFSSFFFGGSMELMAVPKKKVSRHKRGIRNRPKALKPIPVIIRCKSCGRVKLPHFYCCSGDRGSTGEQNS